MPKTTATIKVVSHTPDHGDDSIRMGDTVTFAINPLDAGVITLTGTQDENIVWGIGLFRGDMDVVIQPSPSWTSGPLHVVAELRASVHHRVKTIAETSFEVSA